MKIVSMNAVLYKIYMILIHNSWFIMKIYKKLKHSFYMKIVKMNAVLYKIYMILIHNSRFICAI
jgi:hypothetical protein